MKKLVAICAFLALPFAFGSCSSDDNTVIRKKSDYEGTWVTDSVFYSIPIPGRPTPFEGKHRFEEMRGEGEQIVREQLSLTEDTVTLLETNKRGEDQPTIHGTIKDKTTITFTNGNDTHTPRTIQAVTDQKLTLVWIMTMKEGTYPVTVTYRK